MIVLDLSTKSVLLHIVFHTGLFDANELVKIKYVTKGLHPEEKEIKAAEPADVEKILGFCDSYRTKMAVGLMFYAGLRISEVVKLELDMIDLKHNRIYIPSSISKGSMDRNNELNKKLKRLITDYIKNERISGANTLVTGRNGKSISKNYLAKQCKLAFERAGFPDLHCHLLRHGTGTFLARMGADAKMIKQILGHTSTTVTMRYMNYTAKDRDGLLSKM